MKHTWSLVFFFILCNIEAGEVIWYPLHGNPTDGFVPVYFIVQVDSEVVLIAFGPGQVFDPSVNLPSNQKSVEFPTLFVSYCIYDWDFPDFIEEGTFHVIAGLVPADNRGKYSYEKGDGWIFHQKGLSGLRSSEERFGQSLGWIYIQHYPWVYGVDFGWRYVVEANIAWNANAWWFYEPGFGWFWTTRNLYPNIYHAVEGWMYYEND